MSKFNLKVLILLTGLIVEFKVFSQSNMVVNGDFSGGASSWADCSNLVEAKYSSQQHGGVVPYIPNLFGEVDSGNGAGNPVADADDKKLCQSISGFVIGNVYELSFDVQRRPGPSTCTTLLGQPATVTTQITIDNGAFNVMEAHSGTSWGWSNVTYSFTATSTTHLLTFSPTDVSPCGNLFANISVSEVLLLPVEMFRFNVNCKGETIELTWSTHSESNNNYFTIERSTDAVNFEDVATVNGNGNSSTLINYNWIDDNPINGTAYYRLKQIDFNGEYEYHGIIPVSCEQGGNISVYPNPFENNFTVQLSENTTYPITIEVLDYLGRKVHVQKVETSITVFDMKELPASTYIVKVFNETTQIVERIVKTVQSY